MEWDTGAAHAIVVESGISITKYSKDSKDSKDSTRESIPYNKEKILNTWFVVS